MKDFPDWGVFFHNTATGGRVECSYVGTDYSGEEAAPNGGGLYGGGTFRNNLVSGNDEEGVYVRQSGARVEDNLVGTDANGEEPLGNGGDGIVLAAVADVVVDGNVVGANGDYEPPSAGGATGNGIVLNDGGILGGVTARATLTNNLIGLSRTGADLGLGNGANGIRVEDGARDNDIGLPGAGNRVAASGTDRNGPLGSGNAPGISLYTAGDDNRVLGNTVGLDASGSAAPNRFGISVDNRPACCPGLVTIGGPEPEEGNVITGNESSGINLGLYGSGAVEIIGNTIGLTRPRDRKRHRDLHRERLGGQWGPRPGQRHQRE